MSHYIQFFDDTSTHKRYDNPIAQNHMTNRDQGEINPVSCRELITISSFFCPPETTKISKNLFLKARTNSQPKLPGTSSEDVLNHLSRNYPYHHKWTTIELTI